MTPTERPTAETTTTRVARINGIRIAYESTGSAGVPVVLVHGAWGSHHNWDPVVPGLARHLRVVTYDRRGHSDSDRPSGQGSVLEDVDDLAALIDHLGLAPAWVAGSSFGAVIALRLAAACPDRVRGIIVHEPPLFSLLAANSPAAATYAAIKNGPIADVLRRIAAGDHAGAAALFVDEVAFGPGSWDKLPERMRQTFIGNAPTYLDEENDPGSRTVDESALAGYCGPVLMTSGDESPDMYESARIRLAELLPHAKHAVYRGAGHIPHVTHPDEYVKRVVAFTSPG
jgi:pimeloyl-ACP methyl ester carboxylesterase